MKRCGVLTNDMWCQAVGRAGMEQYTWGCDMQDEFQLQQQLEEEGQE